METVRDRYKQRVEVSFSGLERATLASGYQRLFGRLWRSLVVLPKALAVLRKVTLDLSAVILLVMVVAYFVSAVNQETIVIEAPSVPKALQDRGVTAELLTQLIRARVQGIYATVDSRKASGLDDLDQVVPEPVPVETIQAQIDAYYQSYGIPVPSDTASGSGDGDRLAMDQAFPQRISGADALSQPERVIAATTGSLGLITNQIDALKSTRIAELASPPADPLVIATAGLHLSVDSLAHAARQLLGIESRRRLTVSILCGSADCGDTALSLRVVATADRVVAGEARPLNLADLGSAIDAVADYVLSTYDPQVLASYYYSMPNREAAKRVAGRMVESNHAQIAWSENLLGLIAFEEQDFIAAAMHLKRALKIDPDYVPARVNLGVVRFREGDFMAASDSFAQALGANPRHATTLINLGNARLRLCDWAGAARAYEQALDVEPQSASARFSLELVKSIPALKAYLPEDQEQLTDIADRGSDASASAIKARSLEVVFNAASFCNDLARKPL